MMFGEIWVVDHFEPEARPSCIRKSNSQRGTLVEERDLLGCGYLEHLDPPHQLISFYGWLLHAPALNPVEENICWRGEIVQFNSSAKGPGSESQYIPLGPSPRAPFDDYSETEREKFLSELPLQSLDLLASTFIVNI